MRDTSVLLADGRVLAYTDVGASGSPVVMYFHGAPSSRLDLAVLEDLLAGLNVRVVAPNRPGYGRSSPQPGRRFDDWPADVAALADHLGVGRFAVMGLSSGGPYAVVAAAMLPDGVASAGVVAGITDMAWPAAWVGYDGNEAALMRLGDEAKAAAWCEEHYGPDGSRYLQESIGDLAPADTAMLEDQAVAAAFVTTVGEAFRQGVGGYAQDITVQGRPWSFDPRAISGPVWVLHGEADTLVPLAHARHTIEMMTAGELVTWPDHGHLSILAEIPSLVADLAAPLR